MLFTHAPASERARRVLSKLRQTPRLIQAARDNIKEPPGIFVKVGIETMRGALKFIDDDLPRAFSSVDDLHMLGDLADAQVEASQAVTSYIEYLENEVAPKARASFRLGREKFEQKVRLDEGITLPVERLLAIAPRELATTQEAFRVAGREGQRRRRSDRGLEQDQGRPSGAGRADLVGRGQLEELKTFLERQSIVTVPSGEPITVAPTPDFYRWSFASMWTPGPFESKPSRALYYLTDVDPSMVRRQEDRAPARLQLPDALVDLDPRGLSRSLPALPAPAPGDVEGPQDTTLRADVVCRGLGPLLRADDDRAGLRPRRARDQARTAGGSAHASRPLHRRHQAAHRGPVGGAGRPLVPRRGLPRRSQRPPRGGTRDLRSDLSGLQRRQD